MIDPYLLAELVAFQQHGTLAATAQQLHVTQPTITRGLQKLETDLGVQLFQRQPNRLTLTKTGVLAAQKAQEIIAQNKDFVETIQKYDYNQRNIRIGSVAPGPLILLRQLLATTLTDSKIELASDLMAPEVVAAKLLAHDATLILTNQELATDTIEAPFIGVERLSVNLNKFTLLANKKSVSFSELQGLSFIVLSDIGVWKTLAEAQIPGAKFLYQAQREAFSEITKYSDFPYFTTNISKIDHHYDTSDHDQVTVPINDAAAEMPFYAAYLKTNKKIVTPIIKAMALAWHQYLD